MAFNQLSLCLDLYRIHIQYMMYLLLHTASLSSLNTIFSVTFRLNDLAVLAIFRQRYYIDDIKDSICV